MTDQKPVSIKDEDWTRISPAVRDLILHSINRIDQLEAQIKGHQRQQSQNSGRASEKTITQSPDESLTGHLLVVDDNEMNRDMLSRRLQRQGHTVEVAINGREAIEMVQAKKFDLILLDIMMPELNGYETLEWMKGDEMLSHIPVIMISAIDELESIVRCIKLGAEDYLPKPFNNTLLKARIGASLEKKRLRDQQAAYTHQLNLENQRKTEELEQARRIQCAMLPAAPPQLSYLDIAAYQETASEVGGDYYDFFPQADGTLYLTIGDATGHGVGSGLLVSMTKASLLATNETDLMALIKKINYILNEIDLGTQLNMALMLLKLTSSNDNEITVRAIGGGMPPIYIMRAAGQVEEILISGLPLAITNEATYKVTEFKLGTGDTILLMSDGLSEMFNKQRELLTFDRLTSEIGKIDTTNLSAAEILRSIVNIGHAWASGQPIYDDITLVTLRVK